MGVVHLSSLKERAHNMGLLSSLDTLSKVSLPALKPLIFFFFVHMVKFIVI